MRQRRIKICGSEVHQREEVRRIVIRDTGGMVVHHAVKIYLVR